MNEPIAELLEPYAKTFAALVAKNLEARGVKVVIEPAEKKYAYTKKDVADLLQVSVRTVDRLIRAGKLPQGTPVSNGTDHPRRCWAYQDFSQLMVACLNSRAR